MKALTLTQPWATLVAIGAKRIETRSWSTRYTGPLAIHAAKEFPPEARKLCFYEPFNSALVNSGFVLPSLLPLGKVVAICELIDVRGITSMHCRRQMLGWAPTFPDGRRYIFEITDKELVFGDYRPGRFAWLLHNARLITPTPARGVLGLWNWQEPWAPTMECKVVKADA